MNAADLPTEDGACVRWVAVEETTYRRVAVLDLDWTPGDRVWLMPADERPYDDHALLQVMDGEPFEVWP